jgi:hypothetical protein
MSEPIHLPSGRWQVRCWDPRGRARQFRFIDTKGAAQDYLANVPVCAKAGTLIAFVAPGVSIFAPTTSR